MALLLLATLTTTIIGVRRVHLPTLVVACLCMWAAAVVWVSGVGA